MPSRVEIPATKPSGRTTRTAQKAARPLLFSATDSNPPTHPSGASCDVETSSKSDKGLIQTEQQLLNGPSISKLRDFPNLSTPVVKSPKRTRVILPNSAPTSPVSIPKNPLNIELGNPTTPLSSPISVIHSNPNLQPHTRASTPVFASPLVGGSWDNYLDDPTYQQSGHTFWASRLNGRQIQIVSTDISDLVNSSISTANSLPTNLVPKEAPNMTVEDNSAETWSAIKSDLLEQKTDVEDMVSDCNPELITADTAPSMKEELEKINAARNEYRKAVRKVIADTATPIEASQKQQLESDLASVVKLVNEHKFKVMAKVNQLAPVLSTMSAFEAASIELQRQQLALQQQQLDGRKEEATAVAKPLLDSIVEKCSELDMELDEVSVGELVTGEDHMITRIMLKLSTWKASLQAITVAYQDFQAKTAVRGRAHESYGCCR